MSEEQKPTTPSGAPQWTYIVAAIGVIGTLIWTITSHFIPKPEAAPPAKPAVTASAPAPAPAVTVSGSGNVGVGTMSGGSINVNAPAAPASAAR